MNRLRVFAFLVAALCGFALVDSLPRASRPETEQVAPLGSSVPVGAQHELTVTLRAPAAEERQASKYVLRLFASNLRGSGVRDYLLRVELTGQLNQPLTQRVQAGTYLLVFEHEGSARLARWVEVHADRELSFDLEKAQPRRVKVVVSQDEERRPLLGATVLMSVPIEEELEGTKGGDRTALPFGATTNSRGEVRFSDTPRGPLLVRIYAPGFQPYRAVSEGDLVVRLEPATPLLIRVVDEGKAQAGAEVVLSGASLWPPQSVTTEEDGEIQVTGLSPGRYVLFARKGTRISPLKDDLIIEENLLEPASVTLELRPGHFVHARVSSAEDQPISEAKVSVGASGLGQFRLYGRSNEQGELRLGPLLSPSGLLQARAPGFVAQTIEFPTPDPSDSSETKDAGVTEVKVVLQKAALIEGRVIDERGMPVAGAVVEAVGSGVDKMPYSVTENSEAISDAHFDWAEDWSLDSSRVLIPAGELGVMLGPVPPIPLGEVIGGQGGRLTTDERGYFKITGIPPGEGIVLARHPDYLDGKSPVLSLRPGQGRATEIVLKQGRPLVGRLLDHRGFPVEGASITLSGRDFQRRVYSASDGSFAFASAPAEVRLQINAPDNPLAVLLAQKVEKSERDEELEIELPAPREEAVIRVVDRQGETLSLAQITLTSLDRKIPLRQTRFTHDDGTAVFEGTSSLQVRVELEASGYVQRSLDLTLKAEQEITLEKSLRAVGQVKGVRGRHVAAGAEVLLKSKSFSKKLIADELGEYELTGLPPGPAVLSASHPDYGKASLAVTIEEGVAGRPMELPSLELVPSLVVSGRVVDEAGQAQDGAVIAARRIGSFSTRRELNAVASQSAEDGTFSIEVERGQEIYLYAARLGEAFGFSDRIEAGELDRIEDVVIVIDHPDRAVPYEPATVLVTLEERGSSLLVYAVAEGSQAEQAGVRPEDRIISIDDVEADGVEDARALLSGPLGGQIRLVVQRAGRKLTFLLGREAFVR